MKKWIKIWTKCLCATAVSFSFVACGGKDEVRSSILSAPPSVPVEGELLSGKAVTPQMFIESPAEESVEEDGQLFGVNVTLPGLSDEALSEYSVMLSGEENGKFNTTQIMYKGEVLDENVYARALGKDLEVVIVTRYEAGVEGYQSQASYEGISYIFMKNENQQMELIGEAAMDETLKAFELVEEIRALAAEKQISISEAVVLIYAPDEAIDETTDETTEE